MKGADTESLFHRLRPTSDGKETAQINTANELYTQYDKIASIGLDQISQLMSEHEKCPAQRVEGRREVAMSSVPVISNIHAKSSILLLVRVGKETAKCGEGCTGGRASRPLLQIPNHPLQHVLDLGDLLAEGRNREEDSFGRAANRGWMAVTAKVAGPRNGDDDMMGLSGPRTQELLIPAIFTRFLCRVQRHTDTRRRRSAAKSMGGTQLCWLV